MLDSFNKRIGTEVKGKGLRESGSYSGLSALNDALTGMPVSK
jgi:hypothetical protein